MTYSSTDLRSYRTQQRKQATVRSLSCCCCKSYLRMPSTRGVQTRCDWREGFPFACVVPPELQLTQCPAHEGSRTRRCRSAQDQQHRTHDIHRRSIQDVANARNIVLSNKGKGAATSLALIGWQSSPA